MILWHLICGNSQSKPMVKAGQRDVRLEKTVFCADSMSARCPGGQVTHVSFEKRGLERVGSSSELGLMRPGGGDCGPVAGAGATPAGDLGDHWPGRYRRLCRRLPG